MSYPLFPQRRKHRKWIFALPRVRQQIDQRAIDKGIARKSPLVSSIPLSLHTRLSRFPYEATNDGITSRTLPVLAENPLAVQGRKKDEGHIRRATRVSRAMNGRAAFAALLTLPTMNPGAAVSELRREIA